MSALDSGGGMPAYILLSQFLGHYEGAKRGGFQ